MLSRKPAKVPLKLFGGRPCSDSRLIDHVSGLASASQDHTPMRADSSPARTVAAFGKNSNPESCGAPPCIALSSGAPCPSPFLSAVLLSGMSMPLHSHLPSLP